MLLSKKMSYNYVVTAQKPTAVNACVTGKQTIIDIYISPLFVVFFATCVLAAAPALPAKCSRKRPAAAASCCSAHPDVRVHV